MDGRNTQFIYVPRFKNSKIDAPINLRPRTELLSYKEKPNQPKKKPFRRVREKRVMRVEKHSINILYKIPAI